MTRAIRKYSKDFVAIIVLIVIAAAVATVILSHERLTLPGWVPLVGKDFYMLKGEFSTAQAVTPGQGQTVNVAGVKVGEISNVTLVDGRAEITMKIEPKYAAVYPNATMLLRPKTGLKDMVVELDPGSPRSGHRMKSGATVDIARTEPDVNLDEILSSLDKDTRDYLQLLVHGAGSGLQGQGAELRRVFKRFDPTARDLRKITELLATRRRNIKRGIHNFSELAVALGSKDDDLARFVDSSNAVFRALARQDANLRSTIRELPSSLSTTKTALGKADALAVRLGPTAQALRPGARALAPTQRQVRPFLREATPIIKDQIRPFTRAALPTLKLLHPAIHDLNKSTGDLVTGTKVVNYLLNELAYNPPGNGVGQEGYLFWLSWANHDANSVFSNQDAHGTVRRGLVLASCETINTLTGLAGASDQVKSLVANLAPASCEASGNPGGGD